MTKRNRRRDSPRYFGQFGTTLHDNGYPVIPLIPGEKRPLWTRWQDWCHRTPPYESIEKAAAEHPDAGVGFACGALIVVIDIDEDVGERASRVQQLAELCFGETPLVRFGQKGRRSLFYRVEGEPIESLPCRQVQVLGVGNFTVALGIHPDTGLPYKWANDGPEFTAIDELPSISTKEVAKFKRHLLLHYDIEAVDPGQHDSRTTHHPDRLATAYGSASRLLEHVERDRNGMVVDGRDFFLLYHVTRAFWSNQMCAQLIASNAWTKFSREADLDRPNDRLGRQWCEADALRKARRLVRNSEKFRMDAVTQWRSEARTGSCRPISAREGASLEKLVLLAIVEGVLPKSALKLHRVMAELAEKSGRYTMTVKNLASRLDAAERTVTVVRRKLRETGFWYTLDGRGGRGHRAPYVPNLALVEPLGQPAEAVEESSKTVQPPCHKAFHVGLHVPVAVNDMGASRLPPGVRRVGA